MTLFRLLLLFCLFVGAPAYAQEFPELTGRVVDEADLLAPLQEEQLGERSDALERDIGPQYVIVTVTDLQGYAIEDYGVRLGNHWGIGDAERNDGVLLIVAPSERKVRIEVGYGLKSRITNAVAAAILQDRVLPHFRAGELPEGIIAGSDAIIERLRSTPGEMPAARGTTR